MTIDPLLLVTLPLLGFVLGGFLSGALLERDVDRERRARRDAEQYARHLELRVALAERARVRRGLR